MFIVHIAAGPRGKISLLAVPLSSWFLAISDRFDTHNNAFESWKDGLFLKDLNLRNSVELECSRVN